MAGCYLQRRRIKRRSPPPSKVSFYGMQKIQQRRLIVTKAFNFTGAAKEEIDDGEAEMVRGRQESSAASDHVSLKSSKKKGLSYQTFLFSDDASSR